MLELTVLLNVCGVIEVEKLYLMSDAPDDGEEILAYHKEGKTFHPVKRNAGNTAWLMRWNREYCQYDDQYAGWIHMPVADI